MIGSSSGIQEKCGNNGSLGKFFHRPGVGDGVLQHLVYTAETDVSTKIKLIFCF